MKSFLLLLGIVSTGSLASAQQTYFDSLQLNLQHAKKDDTFRVKALFAVADYYGFIQFDSCIYYATQTSALSQKLNYAYGKYLGFFCTFHGYNSQGNYPMALRAAQNFLKASEGLSKEMPGVLTQAYYFFGLLNREMANYEEAKLQFQTAIQWQKETGQPMEEAFASYSQMGNLYSSLKQTDSALFYAQKGYQLGLHCKMYKIYFPLAISALGNIYLSMGNYDLAKKYFKDAIDQSRPYNNIYFQSRNYNSLAALFDKMNIRDSCIIYAKISLQTCLRHNFAEFTLDAAKLLSKSYEAEGKPDSTLKYIKIMLAAKDSVFSQSKGQQFRQMAFDEIIHQQDIDKAKERYQYQVRSFALLTAVFVFLILAFMFYLNARQKQKDKAKIEGAFKELKTTQSQLVQSEKMASLGELTAGIAHEIQNPLNFVNNFSEVNKELIEELLEERKKEIRDFKMEDDLLNDIKENEQKISHHGKRADTIVKSMLQHSQSSAGTKKPVDISALADEYLRLAYHGIRSRDKSFNSIIQANYDASIGKINIVPQDIGRLLLNLYNNAFYSVNDKKNLKPEGYEPLVMVSTKMIKDCVEIRVKDNGMGIPQKILDKIFQPFFTTKPPGQGTGLGLSLSYDIVKMHGGEIKVDTREGEFTEFIVTLAT